jgi:hypothetical protein
MQTIFTSGSSANRLLLLTPSFRVGLLFCFFFCSGAVFCFAQKSFSSTEVLSQITNYPGKALLYNSTQSLKNSKQGMPVIEQMQFRTSTNRMDANRQSYQFRMGFNTKEMRELHSKKIRTNIHLYEIKDQLLQEKQLINKYECIAKWYFAENQLEGLNEKRILLEDQKTIYKKMMANSLELDIDKLLRTEEDLQELDQEILRSQNEKEFCIKQLFPEEKNPQQITLIKSNWISLQTMQGVLEKAAASPTLTLDQVNQQGDIEQARIDYDFEVAKTNKILDFVQLRYDGRDNLAVQQEFGLGLGLNIPYKSNNRLRINEAQLDVFDEELRLELLRQETEEDFIADYAKFDFLLKEWQLVQKHIEESALESTYNKYRSNGTVHPLTLLRIKESILKSQEELHKIEEEACLLFIDLLATKGLIGKTPAINYLSDDLSFF